jgi:serine/threonine-protein kinase
MTSDTLTTIADTYVLGEILPVDLAVASIDDVRPDDRYERRTLLGEGGMGEIHLCKDRRLGREIAMKLLRHRVTEKPLEHRFLREAYVQGQLEHPSIVPVYDVGRTSDGSAYFTMKRVHGLTLEQIIRGLKDKDPSIVQRYSRRKLLTAFSNVCLTIDFVHARGVLHRDLKPANLILGDFGEVYVLDWGVAKVLASHDLSSDTPFPTHTTAMGALVGTPGYMAPEQVTQTLGEVTGACDIYALGAILYEILTLEPLNQRKTLLGTMMVTVAGGTAPSVRAPDLDIAPELDAITVKATARLAADRFTSGRELSEAIERFLDGDLDLEKRREASTELTETAVKALERATSGPAECEHEHRAEAMQRCARALALDPSNQRALKSMVELILKPPRILPPEAQAELARLRAEAQRAAGHAATRGALGFLIVLCTLLGMGIVSVPLAAALGVALVGLCMTGLYDSRTATPGWRGRFSVIAFGLIALTIATRIAGPFLLAPACVTALVVPVSMTSPRRQWNLILGLGLATMIVPALLEIAGVLPESYQFRDGLLCIVPHLIRFPEAPSMIGLGVTAIGVVALTTWVSRQIFAKHIEAEVRLRVHEWYLKTLFTQPNGVM